MGEFKTVPGGTPVLVASGQPDAGGGEIIGGKEPNDLYGTTGCLFPAFNLLFEWFTRFSCTIRTDKRRTVFITA